MSESQKYTAIPSKEIDYFSYLTEPQLESLKDFWNRLNELIYLPRDKDQRSNTSNNQDQSQTKNDEADEQSKKNETIKLTKDQQLELEEQNELKRLFFETKETPNHSKEEYLEELWNWIMMDDPDKMVLKYIKARKFKSNFESVKMLLNSLKFRIERNLNYIHLETPNIIKLLNTSKAFIFGFDKSGSPIFRIKAANHKINDQTPRELEDFILYSMELTRLFVVPPAENVTIYVDLGGFGMSSMDWKCTSFMISTLESYYPETLNTQIIHNAPWIFQGLWKVISTMIDPVVKSKVLFTAKNEDLLKLIDKENLLKSEGGISNFEWKITSNHPLAESNLKKTKENVDAKGNQPFINPLDVNLNLNEEQKKIKSIELNLRQNLINHFMTLTSIWLSISSQLHSSNPSPEDSSQILIQILDLRDLLKLILRAQYLKLMPYIKPKTIYHFRGILSNEEPGIIKLNKPNNEDGSNNSMSDLIDRNQAREKMIIMGADSAGSKLLESIDEKISSFRSKFISKNLPTDSSLNTSLSQIHTIFQELSNLKLEHS